jgi:hypothetical protein
VIRAAPFSAAAVTVPMIPFILVMASTNAMIVSGAPPNALLSDSSSCSTVEITWEPADRTVNIWLMLWAVPGSARASRSTPPMGPMVAASPSYAVVSVWTMPAMSSCERPDAM